MLVRRTLPALLVSAGLVLLAGGCGTFAQSYRPSGVDELTIPTPSPDPIDFSSTVDNPWLSLKAGAPRVYDASVPGLVGATRTIEVLPGHVDVAGVATTAVRDTLAGRPNSASGSTTQGTTTQDTTSVDYYAQDESGNVWWFGHQGATGSWRAGEHGAEAGLAMAARPRTGDGYRMAYLPGVVEDIATVASADGGTLEVDVTSTLAPGGVVRETYRRGTGLVMRIDAVSGEFDKLRS